MLRKSGFCQRLRPEPIHKDDQTEGVDQVHQHLKALQSMPLNGLVR